MSMHLPDWLMELITFSSGICSSGYTFSRYHLKGLHLSLSFSSNLSNMLEYKRTCNYSRPHSKKSLL